MVPISDDGRRTSSKDTCLLDEGNILSIGRSICSIRVL